MSNQQVLDNTIQFHLIENGKPGFVIDKDGNVVCKYRTEDGGRCALGISMPVDIPEEELDFLSIGDLPVKISLFKDCNLDFLRKLRDCHDFAIKNSIRNATCFKNEYVKRLEFWFGDGSEFAEEYDVELPELKQHLN